MDAAALLAMVKGKQKSMERRERTVKLADGKSRIRILPGWRTATVAGEPVPFWQDFGQHYIKGEDGEVKAVYVCTEKTFGRPCAVCTEVERAMKATKDDDMVAILKEAKASERVLVNALMMDGDDPNTPVILELPPTVFRGYLGLFEEWGAIVDPNEGRDVLVVRSGKGIGTKYTVNPSAKSSAVPAAALKGLHNLDEYVAMESVEQQNKAILAFRSVAGLLSAPAPSATTAAALPAPVATVARDPDVPVTPIPASTVAAAAAIIATAAATPAPAAAPAARDASDVLLDEELDALLAGAK